MNAITKAINIVGGTTVLASACSVSQPFIMQMKSGKPVPPKRCPAIERATNGEVRCEDLCPDLTWNRDSQGRVISYTVAIEDEA